MWNERALYRTREFRAIRPRKPAAEMKSAGATAGAFDYNGNTLTKVVGSNTTSYAWDIENRLSSVTLPGSGGTVNFKYDPFGRRVYKSSSSGTSVFAFDGDNLIEETNSSGAAVARYAQTQNIDEPLAMLRSATTSYYNADGLGSITSLANGAGALAQTYTFDSFGNQTAASGSLVNPFRYTARESDTETSLYYYRARYYDPGIGRFIEEDPVRFRGSFNFFSYVGNAPPTFLDPLGLCRVEIRLNSISAARLYNHAYLLVTDTNGFTYYYRGGPEHSTQGSSGKGLGNLVGTVGLYTPNSVDWDKGYDLPDVILDDGKPCGACMAAKLQDFTNNVNAANIPYDPQTTNSNSFAYGAAKAAGLNPQAPFLSAPGYDTNLPIRQGAPNVRSPQHRERRVHLEETSNHSEHSFGRACSWHCSATIRTGAFPGC